MTGISVEVLPDAGAPQVGITVSGLPAGAPSVVTVQRSTDGVTWETVRGAQRESVTGSAFFRDFVPPLNVPTTYRLVTDAAITPAAVYAWTGAANASASTETRDGVVTRTNLAPTPRTTASTPVIGLPSSATAWGGVLPVLSQPAAADAPSGGGHVTRATLAAAATTGAGDVLYTLGANRPSVTPGDVITASIYVRPSATVTLTPQAQWLTSASAGAGSANGSSTVCPANAWTRLSVTATATATAAFLRMDLDWAAGQSLPAGFTIEADALLPEGGSVLGAYFDGATPPVPAPTTATITVESDTAWLQDPLNPRTAVAVSCVRGTDGVMLLSPSAGEISRVMPADVVQVQGARLPVASLGVRQAPAGVMLHLRALAAEQGALVKALAELVDTAGTVVLRGLPSDLPLDPVAHVIAPEVTDSPIVGGLLGPRRDWVMSVTQVRAPAPRLAVPWWTYDQVKALWAGFSYDAALAARPGASYLDWLRDPTPEAS